MKSDTNIVLVSNRGPVSFEAAEDGFSLKRGAGGLAGALDPVARRLGDEACWIAATNSDADRDALHVGAADGLADVLGYPLYLLDIDPETYDAYYNVCANRMLWFANHCLWDELSIRSFGQSETAAWKQAYEPVNERFARAVCEVSDPSSLVLLQDYHLALTPHYLRAMRPNQVIFHFTHSSFCGPQGLDRLPRPLPRKVINGMLGADLLGFHVAAWVHAFLDCAERIGAEVDRGTGLVEHDGRRTWVREYPIQVDGDDLLKRTERAEVQKWADRFATSGDEIMIMRADRSEPSKNIVRGFEAFGKLLDRRSDLVGRARFVACLYPSRQSMREYQNYTAAIATTVEEINARYPDSIDLYMQDDFDRTIGAYIGYDVLLVNSLMDGMNLVSKEGPIVNRRDGVLVLSEGAGSFEEMGHAAVPIKDATSIEETAAALETAIDMSVDERIRRADALREAASAVEPRHWIEAQLEDLEAIREGRPPVSPAC